MAFQENDLTHKHELRFEVITGADLTPIKTEERIDKGVRVFALQGVYWLNDGQIEFGLRDVAPGYWPVVSNRPNNDQPHNGEVLMYDHDALPRRGRLEYYPVTSDGIIDVLRDGEPCMMRVRYLRQFGQATMLANSEIATDEITATIADAA